MPLNLNLCLNLNLRLNLDLNLNLDLILNINLDVDLNLILKPEALRSICSKIPSLFSEKLFKQKNYLE